MVYKFNTDIHIHTYGEVNRQMRQRDTKRDRETELFSHNQSS